jgi:molecular chaperone HscC
MALEFGLDLERSGSNFARLRDACEFAKKQLSKSHEARIALPAVQGLSGAPQDVELTLTREQLNAVCSSLLERMERPIRRALRDAQLTASEVDAVILVGGTTRMPAVVDLAARVFGRLPLRHLPPDEAVAMGAAVQAALKAGDEAVEDMVVTDVAPFSLGIASGEQVQGQIVAGLFSPIIDRGTVLPASRVQTFHTLSNGQKQIEVEVFQGEHSLCADNQHLGSYTVNGIPPAPAGEQAVEVRFSYDLNGILEVDTIVVATKKKKSLLIDKSPGALSAAQLKRARQDLQRLKFHPREALPNVTALARAEAVVVNLVGPERNALLAAINAFRGAVETQDPEQVELFREMLVRSTRDAGEGR